MMKCNYIDDYIAAIRCGEVKASKELKQAIEYIDSKLSNPDVFVDADKIKEIFSPARTIGGDAGGKKDKNRTAARTNQARSALPARTQRNQWRVLH